jgi:hypothetical protein
MQHDGHQGVQEQRARLSRRVAIGQRVVRTTAAWLMLGALMGASNGLRCDGTLIGIAAHVTAGMILMPAVGALLGLIGSTARESILGGICGGLVVVVGGAFDRNLHSYEALSLSLVLGALVGATCWPWTRTITQVLFCLSAPLALRARRESTIDGDSSATATPDSANP